MKRNRLNRPSLGQRLFSDSGAKNKKTLRWWLLPFFLAFITTFVLATSRPETESLEATVITLPQPSSSPSMTPAAITAEATKPLPDHNTPLLETAPLKQVVQPAAEPVVAETEAENRTVEQTEAITRPSAEPEKVAVSSEATAIHWQEIKVNKGDNLSVLFPRLGLTARDVYQLSRLGKKINPLLSLKPGQTLRFHIIEEDGIKKLARLQLLISPVETFEVFTTEAGYATTTRLRNYDERQLLASGKIENSLFESGIKAGLSDKLVMELAYIFGWDIDFALDLRQGDEFKVIYTENYLDGHKVSDGVIQAAEFTNHGKTYRAIRYTDPKGNSHYYAPDGDSMRKAFSRTPVNFTRISSRFSLGRKHPLLNKIRAHKGVDYAAPRGAPIMATGDGKVTFVGWKGGYGRVVIISHAGRYSTLYGHMSRFKKGLKRGQRVKQGQVIGYVGMSGLATGPHLHYEFRVNGVHRNPLTVKLPRAKALPEQYMADFRQKASPLLAQLDSLSPTTVALR